MEKRAELARVHEQEAKEREKAAAEARQAKQGTAAQAQSVTAQGDGVIVYGFVLPLRFVRYLQEAKRRAQMRQSN